MPSAIQIYIAVATTASVLLAAEALRRRNVDVADSEMRVRDAFRRQHLDEVWDLRPSLIFIKQESESVLDSLLNLVRQNPSGSTELEIHLRDEEAEGAWSREDFGELCEELGINGSFEVREVVDGKLNQSKIVVNVHVDSTDPDLITEFIRQLAQLPRPDPENRAMSFP